MRPARNSDSRPCGASLFWGRADSSFSLLAMSDSSFWLGAGRRVQDRVEGWPVCCGHGGRRSLSLEAPGLELASECLAFVHAHVGVGQQRSQVVGIAANGFSGESPVEWQADLMD